MVRQSSGKQIFTQFFFQKKKFPNFWWWTLMIICGYTILVGTNILRLSPPMSTSSLHFFKKWQKPALKKVRQKKIFSKFDQYCLIGCVISYIFVFLPIREDNFKVSYDHLKFCSNSAVQPVSKSVYLKNGWTCQNFLWGFSITWDQGSNKIIIAGNPG